MDENRGPCTDCVHARGGTSVARAVFSVLPSALQPAVRSAQIQKAEEELQYEREFLSELEILRKRGDNYDQWGRRPNTPRVNYCGVDEFEGRYYAQEIKNALEQGIFKCDQRQVRDGSAVPRSCGTCKYNYHQHVDDLIRALGLVLPRVNPNAPGTLLFGEIRQSLEQQALGEYDEGVAGVGLLTQRPGLLPMCEAWSAEDRLVVGPVVNAGKQCGKWSSGSNRLSRDVLAHLAELKARVDAARAAPIDRRASAAGFQADRDRGTREKDAVADLIEFCLFFLGADPGYAESMASSFYQQEWPGGQGHWVSKKDKWLGMRNAAAMALRQESESRGAALTQEDWDRVGRELLRHIMATNPERIMEIIADMKDDTGLAAPDNNAQEGGSE
jgi:hypothetical protein